MSNLASQLHICGHCDHAEKYMRSCLEYNVSNKVKAQVKVKYATMLYRKRLYSESIPYFEGANKLFEEDKRTENPEYASCCRSLGYAYYKVQELQLSKKFLLKSQKVYEKCRMNDMADELGDKIGILFPP